jgi:hypothetical protein
LGKNTNAIKRNKYASKEVDLEVNAEQKHNIKGPSNISENVTKFECNKVKLHSQIINSILELGNVCYHLVQDLLSSCLLYKNVQIKIYKTIILPLVLYRHEIQYIEDVLRTGC